ncbi:hypothetical protein [Cupriavidus necator]
MTQPLLNIPSIEDDGFKAFQIGRRATAYRPYGFAFCPHDRGTTLHANWVKGYAKAFNAVPRS